ncbi:MAG TPA: pitrilysin family protein [Alphaproteobacteria bacterium]|nr:pitrilysin family protein [Alphaproteobacteria bacterium]
MTVPVRAVRAAALVLAVALPLPAAAVEVQRVVSPMGIEAWLVENDAVPVIAMDFAFKGGLPSDPKGKEGRSNLVSTLLDEGAGDLTSEEFQRRLADAAIRLDFTAGVDAFYGSLKTTSRYSEEAFGLLELALTEPRFDEDAVARMKAAVASQIRRIVNEPDWIARRAYYDAAFPDHPYGQPSRGTIETLANIEIADLRAFVDNRFARDNLVVGVAGDISAEELGRVLDDVFGSLPEHAAPLDVPPTEAQARGETILVRRDGPQSELLMAQEGIARDDPDYYAAIVMNYLLGGGGFESRLTEELRAKRGLTYGVGSYLVEFDEAELLMLQSALSNENVAEALDLIRREWGKMKREGVTEEEVANAKTYLTGSFPLSLTSTDQISGMLIGMQIEELGIDYLDTRNDRIEAVTVGDVNRVAAELLAPDALTTVIVGQPTGELNPDRTRNASEIAARELGLDNS